MVQHLNLEKLACPDARQAMGRDVFESELADRQALMDELAARTPPVALAEVLAKIPARREKGGHNESGPIN
jgi:hypothetical protein